MIRLANAVRLIACAALVVCAGGPLAAAPIGDGTGTTRLPTDIATANSRTRSMLRSGQLQRARDMSQAAAGIDRSDLEAAKLRTVVASLLNSEEKVLVQLVDRVKKLGAKGDVPPLALAWLDFRKKETDKAIQRLKDHIKKDPFDPFMAANYFSLGVFYRAKKDSAEAKKWLKKSLHPDDDSPYFLRGYLLLSQTLEQENRLQQAGIRLAQAKQHFPLSDRVSRALGEFFLRRNNGRRAHAEFQEILTRNKGRSLPAIRFQAASARVMQGYFEEAAKEFESVRTIDGVSKQIVSLATYSLATCRARLGEADEAVKIFTQFLKFEPGNGNAGLRLALLQMVAGKADDVPARLEKIVQKSPKFLAASWALALAYQMNGDMKSSLKTLQAGAKVLADDAPTEKTTAAKQAFFTAMHYLAAGDAKRAQEYFDQTRGLLPGFLPGAGSDFAPGGIDLKKELPKGGSAKVFALSVLYYLVEWDRLATAAADRVTKENPGNLPARYLRGSALARQSRYRPDNEAASRKLRERALAEFKKIAADNPRYAPAYINLYYLTTWLGRTAKEAQAHLRVYLDKKPKDVKALVRISALFGKAGNRSQALRALKRAVEVDPKDATLHVRIGHLYADPRVGDAANAAVHYQKALKTDESLDPVRATLLKLLLAQKKYDQILVHAKKFKELDKYHAAYVPIAAAHMHKREFAAAAATLDKLLKHSPDAPGYLLFKALAETGNGKVRKGIAILKPLADKKVPDAPGRQLASQAETSLALGILYNVKGDHAAAEKYLAAASAAFKKLQDAARHPVPRESARKACARTAFLRANVAVCTNDLGKAAKLYAESAPLGNGFDLERLDMKGFLKGLKKPASFARINLAELYTKFGWYEAAESEAKGAVGADKGNFLALFVQARAAFRIKIASAMPLFKEIIRLQPTFPSGHIGLAAAFYSSERKEKALTILRARVKADPARIAYRRLIGNYLYERKRYAEAIPHFERVLKAEPTEGFLYYGSLGDCYGKLGQTARRIDTYERMVKAVPDDPRGYNQLAWYLAEAGRDLDRALELAQKAVVLGGAAAGLLGSEKLGNIVDTAGWLYYKVAEQTKDTSRQKALLETAEGYLRKAVQLTRETRAEPSLVYHLCVVLEKTEKFKEASARGKRLLERWPAFGERNEVEKLVKRVSAKIKKQPGDSN